MLRGRQRVSADLELSMPVSFPGRERALGQPKLPQKNHFGLGCSSSAEALPVLPVSVWWCFLGTAVLMSSSSRHCVQPRFSLGASGAREHCCCGFVCTLHRHLFLSHPSSRLGTMNCQPCHACRWLTVCFVCQQLVFQLLEPVSGKPS